MAEQKLLLLENSNFFSNSVKFYTELREGKEMLDVTLACDDKSFSVHKLIVMASSLFIRRVIRDSSHPSPYIYLKGITAEDLGAMIDFMYTGEARVPSDNIERFMEAAGELQVEGLYSYDEEQDQDPIEVQPPGPPKPKSKKKKKSKGNSLKAQDEKVKTEEGQDVKASPSPKVDPTSYMKGNTELDTLCENLIIEDVDPESMKKTFKCKECDKEFPKMSKAKLHAEVHLTGFEHKCPQCQKVKKTRSALLMHQYSVHAKQI